MNTSTIINNNRRLLFLIEYSTKILYNDLNQRIYLKNRNGR